MYIIVVGCGKVGYQLARALLAMGHETLVIESDPRRCGPLQDELGSVVLHGDATRVEVLKEAGAARADVLVAVAGRDEDNLTACQLAKNLLGTRKTMALVKDPQNEALFRLLGVDVIISSTHLVLSSIEEAIPGRAMVHLMNLGSPGTELVSINIPSDAAVVGRALGDIQLPPHSFLSLVVKPLGPILPMDEVVIESGDDVVAVTSSEEEQLLYQTLTGVD